MKSINQIVKMGVAKLLLLTGIVLAAGATESLNAGRHCGGLNERHCHNRVNHHAGRHGWKQKHAHAVAATAVAAGAVAEPVVRGRGHVHHGWRARHNAAVAATAVTAGAVAAPAPVRGRGHLRHGHHGHHGHRGAHLRHGHTYCNRRGEHCRRYR